MLHRKAKYHMSLLHYQDLGYGITLIDNAPATPNTMANYIIQSGSSAAFVDVGTSQSSDIQLQILQALQIPLSAVQYLFITHIHLDHAGGAGLLLQHFPNAQVVLHRHAIRYMVAPDKLIESAKAVYGEDEYNRMYHPILPIPSDRIIEAKDGLVLHLGHRPFLIRDTPGHARHHYCLIDIEGNGIFVGDTFGTSYRFCDVDDKHFIYPATTPTQLEPEAYHASVDMLLSYRLPFMYLTHFGRISNIRHGAEQFHRRLNELVRFAQEVEKESERFAMLLAKLNQYVLSELRQHGCKLPTEEILKRYGNENELSAMGLFCWLDRKSKQG